MNLEQAISDLIQAKNWYESHNVQEQVEAHQLGIAALKRIAQSCLAGHTIAEDYLPGETED